MLRSVGLSLAIVLACSHSTPAPTTPSTPSQPTDTTWQLVWSDEFDGSAGSVPDATKWRYDLGDGCAQNLCGWGNSEKEYYTDAPDNVAMNGAGQLVIVARALPAGSTCGGVTCRYTSAKLTTRGLMNAAPGRIEARIKLPSGQGLWPAFWALGHDHPNTPWPMCGELDIMENRGSQPDITSSAVHGPNYAGGSSFNAIRALATSADDFHTYAVEWNTANIRFFVDGVFSFGVSRSDVQSKGPWVFDQSFYLILNLAVGGHFDGDPQSDAIFPATMLVDYVRVYRRG
ncbi:MAG TPA: glycoside hydrolase family 16 protein [Gemmatimonadaceae bacterium]|nr:glycoside hydrolase family 16 protein [Gemmatimonadaceae bacterium]